MRNKGKSRIKSTPKLNAVGEGENTKLAISTRGNYV